MSKGMGSAINHSIYERKYLIEACRLFKGKFDIKILEFAKNKYGELNKFEEPTRLKEIHYSLLALIKKNYKQMYREIMAKYGITSEAQCEDYFDAVTIECVLAYTILLQVLNDGSASAEELCYKYSRDKGYTYTKVDDNGNICFVNDLNYLALYFAEEYGYSGKIVDKELHKKIVGLRKTFENELKNAPRLTKEHIIKIDEGKHI